MGQCSPQVNSRTSRSQCLTMTTKWTIQHNVCQPIRQCPTTARATITSSSPDMQWQSHMQHPLLRTKHLPTKSGTCSMGSPAQSRQAGGRADSRLPICNTKGAQEPDCLRGLRQPRHTVLGSSDESP